MSATIDDAEFDALTAASRHLHGHMFVLPVAVWIARTGPSAITVSEILRGLEGRLDRHRIIEALERLESIGAMDELPRIGPRNSPRCFQRASSPYWDFAVTYSQSRASVEI